MKRNNPRHVAPVHMWLVEPPPAEVKRAIERLARAPDVRHLAVMPDVHLAAGVCVGNVLATSHLLYPQAVGGDIGCGMTALAFDADSASVHDAANEILAALTVAVPAMRHPSRDSAPPLPSELLASALSTPALITAATREGRVEFGTLGRGNHFVELQSDEDGALWLMIHSGSRHMGQAITAHHLRAAASAPGGFYFLDADSPSGQAYLADVAWARAYAAASRKQMAHAVARALATQISAAPRWDTLLSCDHNHVQVEAHGNNARLVHRKGAAPARLDEPGIIPGSMGTRSFHTRGRGCLTALHSSSHGAGRRLSRDQARRMIPSRRFKAEMNAVHFDDSLADKLRDESPSAYKDIDAVMRAQRELTRITRRLRPLLVYKGI